MAPAHADKFRKSEEKEKSKEKLDFDNNSPRSASVESTYSKYDV